EAHRHPRTSEHSRSGKLFGNLPLRTWYSVEIENLSINLCPPFSKVTVVNGKPFAQHFIFERYRTNAKPPMKAAAHINASPCQTRNVFPSSIALNDRELPQADEFNRSTNIVQLVP